MNNKDKKSAFETLRGLYVKYREQISYVFWGVMTTLVDLVVYFILANVFGVHYMASQVIAWIAAVLFAFVTNRRFVFHSEKTGLKAVSIELAAFAGGRVFSLLCQLALMYLGNDVLGLGQNLVKIVTTVVVFVLNYLISKLIVFRKQNGDRDYSRPQ